MRRREFITLIGSAAVSLFKPLAVGAQQAERLAGSDTLVSRLLR
jgi:hypothetical protein